MSVITLNGMTFDLSTPNGRMVATFLSGISQFERDLISERVKSGMAAAKARGKSSAAGSANGRKPTASAPRCSPWLLKARVIG